MGELATDQAYLDRIRRRREEILARVDAALARSGRAADAARVMAVSKTVGVDEVAAAIEAGYRFFGENRPQELIRKLEGLAARKDAPQADEKDGAAGGSNGATSFSAAGSAASARRARLLGVPCL